MKKVSNNADKKSGTVLLQPATSYMKKKMRPKKKYHPGPNSLANLKPFKKGEVNNPWGRDGKPGKFGFEFHNEGIRATLLRIGRLKVPSNDVIAGLKRQWPDVPWETMTVDEAINLRVKLCALHGDPWAQDFNAERTEGKVPNTILTDPPKPDTDLTDEEKAIVADALEKFRKAKSANT